LALLTLAKGALSCSCYKTCHCYNNDGIPNDNATQTVCNRFDAGSTSFTDGACRYVGPSVNYDGRYGNYIVMNNCDWREMCAQAGATGADSRCDEKVPGSYKIAAPHN
ncbi:hypothetical protein LY78DRAFT_592276, partial [Colletotrichum sublineola]